MSWNNCYKKFEDKLKAFVREFGIIVAVTKSRNPYDYFNCITGKPKRRRPLVERIKAILKKNDKNTDDPEY
ncbi:MAG: hypothetical protein PUB10_07680 [Clostridiales bacterium]|nr:hypothetical protein [Clostridiales bacterium]